jgi:hypothetical protein
MADANASKLGLTVICAVKEPARSDSPDTA